MQKTITIQSAEIVNNKLKLSVNETIKGFIPQEHMLVDSDFFSFIYLMERENEYTYVVIPEPFWVIVRDSIALKQPVILTSNNDEIELNNFKEELDYLVSNIKGNGNYGEKMVEKIETLF